jgi:hypothetical protein
MSAYTDAVEAGLKGLSGVSTGLCPHCEDCADAHGYASVAEYDAAYEAGTACDEGSFSWCDCGICGSHLGGDRYHWHAILDGRIVHFDDACSDCVVYLANGDESEAIAIEDDE